MHTTHTSSAPSTESAASAGRKCAPGGGRRRVAAAFACLAVLGLFGTACSGGSKAADSKSSATSGGKTDADEEVAYHKCLREHGAEVHEPKGGDNKKGAVVGFKNKAAMEKATKACRDKAPNGTGAGTMSQADKDRAVKYSACMRKHGVDAPGPKANGMTKARPMPKGEAAKKKYAAAGKACQGELQ